MYEASRQASPQNATNHMFIVTIFRFVNTANREKAKIEDALA